MSTRPETARRVRVIVFLVAAAALFVGTVFTLGRSQSFFSRKVTLHTSFDDVGGLVVGAPVRLAGLDIGIVQKIEFDRQLAIKKVHVALGVESRYLPRIRTDSIAKLASKGLLGDTIINITIGSVDAAPLEAGAQLKSAESAGTAEVIDEVRDAVTALRSLTGRVESRVDAVLTDELARDLHRFMRSTASVVEQVEKGRVVADLQRSLHGFDRLTGDADLAVEDARRLLIAVRQGPGLVHALLYDPTGAATLRDLRQASEGLAALITEVKTGKGLVHSLIYDREQGELIANLTALSRSLRNVGTSVEKGEGTVGALLRDPTVYEDLKLILGRVERNRLLKTLVRYTIKQDSLSR